MRGPDQAPASLVMEVHDGPHHGQSRKAQTGLDCSRRSGLADSTYVRTLSRPTMNEEPRMTAVKAKPSIVFVHGIWADGSCFSKLIPTLQAEGHEVIAAQYGLGSLAGA